jgi:hypothetical protein
MDVPLRIVMGLGSAFVCLIPARYRSWWPVRDERDLVVPAILSGVVEMAIGVPGAVIWVAITLQSGFTLAVNPFMAGPFLLIEGIVRALAAISSGEVLPTLPLQLLAWLHGRIESADERRRMGPLVPDVIQHGDGEVWDLRVLSCRPKSHWTSYVTIRYGDRFFHLVARETILTPLRFVYLLKESPETRLVVVVYEYSPEEVLRDDALPRRWQPGL